MELQPQIRTLRAQRLSRVLGLLAFSALVAFFFLSPARAQETPVETDVDAQETPTGAQETVVRIRIDPTTEQPVAKGDVFVAQVLVDNVEHLGSFDFILEYDPDRVEPVDVQDEDVTPVSDEAFDEEDRAITVQGDLGEFLRSSERGVICGGPFIRRSVSDQVLALCASPALPVCLGGPAGVTGSGLLGTVVFRSKGGDMTALRLASSTLTSDDVEPPCDPEVLEPELIPHSQGAAVSVALTGGDGLSAVLIGIIIGVVVVLLAAGGIGALLWIRRGATPSS